MIVVFIIVVLLLIFIFMKKNKNVYETAYDLGVNFLDNIEYSPNYAVMFDIDDTLLFSKNYKPIKPIIKLLGECNKRNITVIIITARDSMYTYETIDDLLHLDIYPKKFIFDSGFVPKNAVFYDYIYLRHSPKDNHEMFKSNMKEYFAKNNIFTIMSVGDNEIDIIGKYSGYGIKLPNVNDPRLFHKNNFGQMVHVKI
jgi:hypothetical protein